MSKRPLLFLSFFLIFACSNQIITKHKTDNTISNKRKRDMEMKNSPKNTISEEEVVAGEQTNAVIGTQPEGAEISLDGEYIGISNLLYETTTGPHEISVKLEGYNDTTFFVVFSGENNILDIPLYANVLTTTMHESSSFSFLSGLFRSKKSVPTRLYKQSKTKRKKLIMSPKYSTAKVSSNSGYVVNTIYEEEDGSVNGAKIQSSFVEEKKELAFIKAADNSVSTFSIDVDKGSYSQVRNYISKGAMPPVENVRSEEMLNYFKYDYPTPHLFNHKFVRSF